MVVVVVLRLDLTILQLPPVLSQSLRLWGWSSVAGNKISGCPSLVQCLILQVREAVYHGSLAVTDPTA